jgi:PDZ domain-containing protein
MTQRIWAGLLALVLAVGVWASAIREPLPFVTEAPGLTVNVLGEHDGKPVIQVSGHKVYRDDGQLRLTTVYVTLPDTKLNLFALMSAYLTPDDAVVPYTNVYAPQATNETDQQQGRYQMTSSQDAAIAAAMRELGYDVPQVPSVFKVAAGTPAEGVLEAGDRILSVDGTAVATLNGLRKAIQQAPDGEPLSIQIRRDGQKRTVSITPTTRDGRKVIGVDIAPSYDFPFQVELDIDPNIGGPSAGLMFSLGIYDTLTPGSLTGGDIIAGTGTLDEKGKVGPIGGIDQKIAASREAGAELFLVPQGNCRDVADSRHGDMRLVKVSTMSDALDSLKAYAADPDGSLPTCSTATTKAGADG